MERMYRVLGFWTGIFTIMFFIGNMYSTSLIFLCQTGFFVFLSYLKLTERMYIYIFGAYLTVFFIGFTYWTTFMMIPGTLVTDNEIQKKSNGYSIAFFILKPFIYLNLLWLRPIDLRIDLSCTKT